MHRTVLAIVYNHTYIYTLSIVISVRALGKLSNCCLISPRTIILEFLQISLRRRNLSALSYWLSPYHGDFADIAKK